MALPADEFPAPARPLHRVPSFDVATSDHDAELERTMRLIADDDSETLTEPEGPPEEEADMTLTEPTTHDDDVEDDSVAVHAEGEEPGPVGDPPAEVPAPPSPTSPPPPPPPQPAAPTGKEAGTEGKPLAPPTPIVREVNPSKKKLTVEGEIEVYTARVLELALLVRAIAAFVNTKGGATKTTQAVFLTSLFAELTRMLTLLIDANNNSGNSADRLGIERSMTIQLRELLAFIDSSQHITFRDLFARCQTSRHGVISVASDDVESRRTHSLGRENFRKLYRLGANNSVLSALDTGNDMLGAANMAAVDVADVLVFTAITNTSPLAGWPVIGGMFSNGDGFNAMVKGARSTMLMYQKSGFAEKVKRSVVILTGVRESDVGRYKEFLLSPPDPKTDPDARVEHEGPIICVPPDRYVRRDGPIDLNKVKRRTYLAQLKAVVAILEQALLWQQFQAEEAAAGRGDGQTGRQNGSSRSQRRRGNTGRLPTGRPGQDDQHTKGDI